MATDWAAVGVQAIVGVAAAGATVWAARGALKGAVESDRIDRREERHEGRRVALQSVLAALRTNVTLLDGDVVALNAVITLDRNAVVGAAAYLGGLPEGVGGAVRQADGAMLRWNAAADYATGSSHVSPGAYSDWFREEKA